MATIYFADGTTTEIASASTRNIKKGADEDYIKEITDEIECYNLEEDEKALVEAHPNARFFQALDDVCGAWAQPLYIFAVED